MSEFKTVFVVVLVLLSSVFVLSVPSSEQVAGDNVEQVESPDVGHLFGWGLTDSRTSSSTSQFEDVGFVEASLSS